MGRGVGLENADAGGGCGAGLPCVSSGEHRTYMQSRALNQEKSPLCREHRGLVLHQAPASLGRRAGFFRAGIEEQLPDESGHDRTQDRGNQEEPDLLDGVACNQERGSQASGRVDRRPGYGNSHQVDEHQ